MAFRDDLEAQVQRAEAAEREVERLRGELAAARAAKERVERPPPVAPATEGEQEARRLGIRRTVGGIAAGLGGVTALSLLVGATQSPGSGNATYDAVEFVAYMVMSVALVAAGVLGAARPAEARVPVLLWCGLAVLVEVADMVAETRLFGAPSSWTMSAVMLAVPVVLAAVFARPARRRA